MMTLQEEIEKQRAKFHTESYSMSIGEWMSLYEDNEVRIHTNFNKNKASKWNDEEKTRFIESILLGYPLPPIFVLRRSDGVWDVYDGSERLAAIYQFVGILKDESGNLVEPLLLGKSKYLPSLESKSWKEPDDPLNSLKMRQRFYIIHAKFPAIVHTQSDTALAERAEEFIKYNLLQWSSIGQDLPS